MMKNRAGLLALLVLAIATILMVFFVMPRISDDGKDNAPTTASGDAAKTPASEPAKPAEDLATVATEKMGRLKAEAEKAAQALVSLFADGKVPAAEAYAGAKAEAEKALAALAALDVPEALEASLKETMTAARGNAEKALALLKTLPSDPAAAGAAIGTVVDALAGKAVTAPEAPAPQTEAPATTEQPAQAEAPATTGPIVPRFDVLRVEPDGSAVIAGNAEPGAKLEILDGDTVIFQTEVGISGDFAVILDKPLSPGDHSLQLRVTGKDGKPVTSEEVATISIPENGNGNLLAMVTRPGEASRVITAPETVNQADKKARVPAEETPAAQTAEAPQATAEPQNEATAQQPTEATKPAPAPEVQVSAVEIEGDRIFVAGTAAPGSAVRAWADDALIGAATADNTGHFVIEGTTALAVGDHTIRAELLDADGKVLVRASVPFNRPEGHQVAVVAQSKTAGAGQPEAMVPLDRATFETMRGSVGKAFGILQGLFADGKKPAAEEVAAARSATEIGLQSLIDYRLGAGVDSDYAQFVTQTAARARNALEALKALAADADAVREGLPKVAELINAVLEPLPAAAVAEAQTTAEKPAAQAAPNASTAPAAEPQAPAPAAEPAQAPTETAADAPKTIEQAPLTESKNTVIIRRGDTLWQISRRVYGLGVRYTTIYLANANKITNPDLIEPGQVFQVPHDALPNAEELHRKRLKGETID
ncbi:LysM peptidoglycan-binding domain-containing protein [Ciceribacter ferrooxidans]|uniref:LysM peptidoglycan-binding domain-containing protein n=1 Tax=Ciceribacter ferrooxidans TaxID=2509717 RepID=A0A4Q2TJF1_9HYPH|nr:LysM peptidoglycan-binding domain-containing protein [Ciceribacter ferrooxidans]RYC17807.1 LysM peptidoglycan-binding domain-containing protein [Ciceribacter ferrooxidans]